MKQELDDLNIQNKISELLKKATILSLEINALLSLLERKNPKLTPQEQKIYILIEEGYSTQEISQLIAIRKEVISTHLSNIKRKIGKIPKKQEVDHVK